MSNVDLLSAGFSAILGTEVVPQKTGEKLSIHDLFSQTYVMQPVVETVDPDEGFDVNLFSLCGIQREIIRVSGKQTIEQVEIKIESVLGIPAHQLRLIYDGRRLNRYQTVNDYGIQPHATIQVALEMSGGGGPLPRAFNTDELDPDFDYDFTDVKDDGSRYMRGGFEYKRPYGWKRIAIKVVGRYGDDKWLGPNGIRTDQARGEWPVSYHGTNMSGAKMILKQGYKPGPRALYGKGIYTSPSLEMVEKYYAQEFTHKGKTYKMVLQNRVNPDRRNRHLQIIRASQTGAGADYWLSSACTDDVRPYGILIREVPKPGTQPMAIHPPPAVHGPQPSPPQRATRQNRKRKSNP